MKTIPLSQGKFAIVDDADYEVQSRFSWSAAKGDSTYYAQRKARTKDGKARTVMMHRSIMGDIPELQVDHINGNGLDNRRENLRWATGGQNQSNRRSFVGTSKFKGVYWEKGKKRWRAWIQSGGKRMNIGHFHDEEEAARAYDREAKKHFGKYARLNFPANFWEEI